MKKIIIGISIVFIVSTQIVKGCDICGCGVGNNYLGIMPDFQKHIFGIRYRNNSLRTHIGVGGITSYLTTTEQYTTAEIWGGWNLSAHLRLIANIPYSFNTRINNAENLQKNGLGDITLSGYYELLNQKKTLHQKLIIQNLWVGAGIKLPTGKYNPADKNTNMQSTNLFQLGTGSTDFLLAGMYDMRIQDVGINVSANYKINGTNNYDYQYGNKFSTTAQVYYKFRIANQLTLAPNLGCQYENAGLDTDQSLQVDISGGKLLLGTIGIESTLNKMAVGANWQTPLSQNLANGFVKANNRLMIHIAWLF
ncbi:MAG: transporter [Bacteroidota bacterium]|nr:transporter [Bacteroidota bacterium]